MEDLRRSDGETVSSNLKNQETIEARNTRYNSTRKIPQSFNSSNTQSREIIVNQHQKIYRKACNPRVF